MTVYFIKNPLGHVKIGFTVDTTPESRVRSLQTGNSQELTVLAFCPGGKALERELHQRFRSQRLSGEWFESSPRLLSLASYVKAFGRADGWGDAGDPVERTLRMAARADISPDPEGIWELAKRTISSPQRSERDDLPSILERSWSSVAAPAHRLVSHVLSGRREGFCWSAEWRDANGDWSEFRHQRGLVATAEALAGASHDPIATAAVWIQAALRQLSGRSASAHRMAGLFPDSRWLNEQAFAAWPVDYHQWVSQTLPIPVELPEKAVVSVHEFVRATALTQAATYARYRVVASYLQNWSETIRRSAA